LKIRVDQITEKQVRLTAEELPEEYPTLRELTEAGEVAFLRPISIEITARREYDHIRVEGRVGTAARLDCSRCLAPFETEIDAPFTTFYNRKTGAPLDSEKELTEEDLITTDFDGEYIDFSSEIAEQVMMAMPFKPLCKEDCRGLCSNCGADLNVVDCGCDRVTKESKFNALKDFKLKK
jgi:uncharacterized protein